MKKFLLLAMAAGLVFGECVQRERVDKMTDAKNYYYSCYNKGTIKEGIVFLADQNLKINYHNQFILTVEEPFAVRISEEFYTPYQNIIIRADKNKAFAAKLEIDEDKINVGRIYAYNLSSEQIEQIKAADMLLIQYVTYQGDTKILEIDVSKLKEFQRTNQ